MKELIAEIQSLGVRIPMDLPCSVSRSGGAGPAEGRSLLIDGIAVNAPMQSRYVANSPYRLQLIDGQMWLFRGNQARCPIDVVAPPQFYEMKTRSGLPYSQIALLHGKSCLASTVIQNCIYWGTPQQCRFCATGVSLAQGKTVARKTPSQLAEVAEAAVKEGIDHIVLTSGTAGADRELDHLADCTRAIREVVDLPVHVQFAPPQDLGRLELLRDSGVDTVGIHVESFDPDILRRVAPAKANLGYNRYKAAWRKAVEIFGPNQVSSFLIVGLGESLDSIVEGSEVMADLGVYPYIVPHRPTPGSVMENSQPPPPETMCWVYERVAAILKRNGLSSNQHRAGCVRCGACSALPVYEQPVERINCHVARTPAELDQALATRREVFVKEQGLFSGSDVDENDSRSIHLVCEQDGQIVGTVRVYPLNGNGHWIGGRLAVSKANRSYRAGALLVREAMKRVKKHGCQKFTAEIQLPNVPFFVRLGWHPVGDPTPHLGMLHQTMEADLNRVQPNA